MEFELANIRRFFQLDLQQPPSWVEIEKLLFTSLFYLIDRENRR